MIKYIARIDNNFLNKINSLITAVNMVAPEEISNQFHALSMAIKHLTERVEKLEKEHIADPSKKMPMAELIEDYGYDLAEAVEECGDLFKKGPIEPVTITDVFNEMQQLRADLWNKIEWLGEKIDAKIPCKKCKK